MQLCIHRGANQVGGSCVELTCQNATILIDVGLPLDFDFSDDPESHLPQPLFDQLRDGNKNIDAVILSHAHLDHYGLAGMLPEGIPVYCGKVSAELMAITGQTSPEKEWGAGHIILLILQLKRLNFASNMALKGLFGGEKYPFKERKAH